MRKQRDPDYVPEGMAPVRYSRARVSTQSVSRPSVQLQPLPARTSVEGAALMPAPARSHAMKALLSCELMHADISKLLIVYHVVETRQEQEDSILEALALAVKAMKLHHGLALPSLLPHMRLLHVQLDDLGLCKAYQGAGPQEAPTAAISVLEILAGIPIMLLSSDTNALSTAARVALAAFQIKQDLVGAALQGHGVSSADVELALRMVPTMQNAMDCFAHYAPPSVPLAALHPWSMLQPAVERILQLDPGNAIHAILLAHSKDDQVAKGNVLAAALQRLPQNELWEPMLLEHFCHAVLLGSQGATYEVGSFLKLLDKAVAGRALLRSWADQDLLAWGSFAVDPDVKWRCLGVSLPLSTKLRDGVVAENTLLLSHTLRSLQEEVENIRCVKCKQPSDNPYFSTTQQNVQYCPPCYEAWIRPSLS